MPSQSDLMSGIQKLKRFGEARDRRYEYTGRDVILTDDEAVAILRQLPNALVRAATTPAWADATVREMPVVGPRPREGYCPEYNDTFGGMCNRPLDNGRCDRAGEHREVGA